MGGPLGPVKPISGRVLSKPLPAIPVGDKSEVHALRVPQCEVESVCSERALRKVMGALDHAVDSRDNLIGVGLTLADILLTPMIASVKAMPEGKELMAAFPNLRRAADKLIERPSYVAATHPPPA